MRVWKIAIRPVLLAVFLMAPAMAAQAQEYYLDLHIGYSRVENGDLESTGATAIGEYADQQAFGGSLGFVDMSGIRLEGELTYRANDIDAIGGAPAKGRFSSLALMANLLYEMEIGGGGYGFDGGGYWPVRPYIGIGGGGMQYSMNATFTLGAADSIDDSTYALAWQGIVGAGWALSESSILTLDYRYVVSENVGLSDTGGAAFEIDAAQATLMLGLRTLF